MLLGGELGLLWSLVVLVVGWLVARWKWRRAAARREEIKRLMALASEEAARAEIEASRSYSSALAYETAGEELVVGLGSSPGRQFQYQCEVCFSPTITRCKQCKTVHYCSKKCQIFHWRQGHRDECRSFASHQNIDAGPQSCPKEFKQDEMRSSQNVSGNEATRTDKPGESSSGNSNTILHVPGENDDTESETSDDGKRTDIEVKASFQSLPDEYSSSNASKRKLKDGDRRNGQSTLMNEELMKPPISEPSLTNSSISNRLNSDCIDIDEKSESSTSSECNTPGSDEHSLSEHSTSSSDFWGGEVEPIKSKINALDELPDANTFNSHSSSKINYHVNMTSVLADDLCPAITMATKSIALPEVSEDSLKSRGPLIVSHKLSGQTGVSNTSAGCSSKEEANLSSSKHVSHGHMPSKHVGISSLQSVARKQLNHETNGVSNAVKSLRNDSSRVGSSEVHLTSGACIKKPTILTAQSIDNDCVRRDASCSFDGSVDVQRATSGTNQSARRVLEQLRSSSLIRNGLGGGSGNVGKYEVSCPYELFVKLYNWNEVELRPCGLLNCGNSCYANAVLQCLAFTPPLTAYFLQGLHAKTCQKKEWCFTCEFEVLVKKSKEGNCLSPARLMSQMQFVASHLGNGREEDAHEFLRVAIEAMQLACLKEAGIDTPSSLDEEATLLGLTFGGYLQSKIECMRCGGKSRQRERIMDLTVEIGGDIQTLENALRQFTHSEILDGENKYQCGRCKSYERAKKKLRVLEAPNVLTIALKRFQSGKYGKLNKAVKFPDILNLAVYMSETSDNSPIYQLYGVVVHLDAMNSTYSGHYVCYIKNKQGKWFKADDSMVQAVDLEKVLSNDAYMLFYARCSPRAPRLIRSSMAPHPKRANNNHIIHKFNTHSAEPWDDSHHHQHLMRPYLEEDFGSEHSSFFSESGSYSSNRESISTDEISYSSDAETNCSSCSFKTSPDERDSFWASKVDVSSSGKNGGNLHSLCSSNKGYCCRLDRCSCREVESNKLGTSDNVKGGVYSRRSMS